MRLADLQALPVAPDDAKASILDLLTVAAGNGRTNVPMKEIIDMMSSQGFNVTPGMIMDIVKGNEMVSRSTRSEIILKSDGNSEEPTKDDASAEHDKHKVSGMASKAAKSAIKR